MDFEQQNALLEMLGIGVTHAIPYRAWSKTIEHIFGVIETQWIRELPGWCGNGIAAKPETVLKDVRDGKLMSYEEFAAYWVNAILPAYHDYKSESAVNSPLEIYRSCETARADVPSHAMLVIAKMLRTERTIQTTGIRWNNDYYCDAALAPLVGEKVLVLYSRQDDSSVTVLHNGNFVCEAVRRSRMKLVGEDQERLEAHLKEQQSTKRGIREALTLPRTRIRQLNTMITECPDITAASSVTSIIHERTYRDQQHAKQQRANAEERSQKATSERMRSVGVRAARPSSTPKRSNTAKADIKKGARHDMVDHQKSVAKSTGIQAYAQGFAAQQLAGGMAQGQPMVDVTEPFP